MICGAAGSMAVPQDALTLDLGNLNIFGEDNTTNNTSNNTTINDSAYGRSSENSYNDYSNVRSSSSNNRQNTQTNTKRSYSTPKSNYKTNLSNDDPDETKTTNDSKQT